MALSTVNKLAEWRKRMKMMNMKRLRVLYVLMLITFVQTCWAVGKEDITKKSVEPDAIDPCSKYDRINMAKCLGLRIDEVDKELENTINDLVEGFWDKESEEALRKAQEAWLRFIRLDCKFQKPNKGGREWRLVYNSCLLKHQKERVRQLKAIPSCGNGCIH